MGEIDSLDIKIKASAKEAANAIDKFCVKLGELDKKLGSIQNQDAFKKFADAAKVASSSMNGIAKSAQNAQAKTAQAMAKAGKAVQSIQKPAEQAKKNISSIVEEMNKKFSALTPNVDFSKITAETNKYEKQLMNAQNQLQRIMATSSADKQVKSIERLVVKIKEAQNALDLIKKQKIQNATPLQSQEELLKLAQRAVMSKNTVDSSAYEKVRESMSNVADLSKEMADNTARWNAYLKDTTTEATTFSDVLKNVKPLEFSGNFYEMEKWVDELNKKLITLLNKQEKLSDLGANMNTQRMQSMTYEIEQLTKTLDVYEAKVEEARSKGQLDLKVPKLNEVTGQVTSLGEKLSNLKITVPTDNMEKLQKQIEKIKKQYSDMVDSINKKSQSMQFYGASLDFKKKQVELKALQSEYDKLIQKQKELSLSGGYKLNTKGFQESIGGMKKAVSSVHSSLNGSNKKLNNIAKRMLSVVAPTKKARAALKGFDVTNVGLAKSLLRTSKMLKLMIVRMALRGVIDGVKTGMQNLVQYSDEANASMSLLVNSLNQLKNSFAAAVSPALNVFTPAINAIIQACISATNAINQLISALTGSGTWIKATVLTDNFAESLKKASKAAKTLAIDELNINSGDSGAGSVTNPKDMFDTEEVEQKYIDLADKIKSIFERLFEPLKQSWDTSGNYVFDSWKKALESIGELAKSVGRDFLGVWQQPETIEIFNNILHIIGDIGQSVSNIADNFRKAWEENNTGLHILENIRDIIGVIVSNIHDAAEATVTWSSKLDFSPLLGRIEEFTNSLIPVFDTLSGILTDFYTMVLLPLGKWTLEKGLPDLLQVFIGFNNKVDWDSLRNNLQEFWKHLEPFAETVGEGLVIFIRRISDALANFLNSEAFEGFLKSVENWMDKVSPEDVANGFEKIAKAIIDLKTALVALKAASAGITTLSAILKVVELFKGINFSGLVSGISSLGTAFVGFATANPEILVAAFDKISHIFEGTIFDPNTWTGIAGQVRDAIMTVIYAIDDAIGKAIDVVKETLQTIFNWDETLSLFEQAKDNFKKGGVYILEGILDGFAGAIAFILEPVKDLFTAIYNAICDVFGIHSPAETMKPLGEYIFLGIIEGFTSLFDTFTEKINEFWENYVLPWFTVEKWTELLGNILVAAQTKWDEIVEWWNGTALVTWWEESVVPWFSLEKWLEVLNNVKESFNTKWTETSTQWVANLTKWWTVNVAPWFTKKKWDDMLAKVPTAFKDAFKAAANGAIGFLNGVIDGVESLVNRAIDGLKKLAEAASKVPGINFSIDIPNVSFPRIPTFQTGGFPEDGLFMANHNELVGRFSNGKTAVASNEMIVAGIEEAAYRGFSRAYEDNNREANLLSEILDAVREGKEISIDGRSLVSAVEERSNRNGFSFA